MLTLIFIFCLIGLCGRFLTWGIKASWGLLKLICWVIFFPVLLLAMAFSGLIYLAFILVIAAIGVSLVSAVV